MEHGNPGDEPRTVWVFPATPDFDIRQIPLEDHPSPLWQELGCKRALVLFTDSSLLSVVWGDTRNELHPPESSYDASFIVGPGQVWNDGVSDEALSHVTAETVNVFIGAYATLCHCRTIHNRREPNQ